MSVFLFFNVYLLPVMVNKDAYEIYPPEEALDRLGFEGDLWQLFCVVGTSMVFTSQRRFAR